MADVSVSEAPPAPDAQLPPVQYPTFEEELENLACRFIVNLPANELTSIERIGFQVELAYVRATDPQPLVLPRLPMPAEP